IFIDKRDRLWVGTTQSGLCLVYPDKNSFYEYKSDPLDPASLQSDHITGIFQDRSGMIWLGTFTAGAQRYNPDESKFLVYSFHSGQSFTQGNKSVRAVAEDSLQGLWVGTSDGLFILDRKTGISANYYSRQRDSNSLSVTSIRAICRDKEGKMWIGTD